MQGCGSVQESYPAPEFLSKCRIGREAVLLGTEPQARSEIRAWLQCKTESASHAEARDGLLANIPPPTPPESPDRKRRESATLFFREKIRNEGRSNCDEGGLADADQSVSDKQFAISVSDGGKQGEPTPENCSQHDDQLARIAVSEWADERRCHHVAQQKCAGQVSDLGFTDMEFVLHQRLHRKEHIAVCVVEQIQCGEQKQRSLGMKIVSGHGKRNIACAAWQGGPGASCREGF